MSCLVLAGLPIPWISLGGDECAVKILERISENRAEVEKLEILHRHLPRLDLREPAPRAVPAGALKLRREFVLRPTLMVAHFANCRTDGVFGRIERHPSRWRVVPRPLVIAPDEVQDAGSPLARNRCLRKRLGARNRITPPWLPTKPTPAQTATTSPAHPSARAAEGPEDSAQEPRARRGNVPHRSAETSAASAGPDDERAGRATPP